MKQAKILRKDGRLLVPHCGVVEGSWERMRGLLGHSSLRPGEGLWFPRCTSVHTFFMRFSIDVAFLDRQGGVIALYHSLRPWRHSWIHPFAAAGGTLEAHAGLFRKEGLEKGEVLKLCLSS